MHVPGPDLHPAAVPHERLPGHGLFHDHDQRGQGGPDGQGAAGQGGQGEAPVSAQRALFLNSLPSPTGPSAFDAAQ